MKGASLYAEVDDIQESGPLFEQIVGQITKCAGESAGEMIKAAVKFMVTDVRPQEDRGQRWNISEN